MTDEKKSIFQLTDEEAENIAGGTPAETQEILDYIRDHDPEGWASIANSGRPVTWAALRYLYDSGIPLVWMSASDMGANSYRIGDKDHLDQSQEITHEQLMAMLREKF